MKTAAIAPFSGHAAALFSGLAAPYVRKVRELIAPHVFQTQQEFSAHALMVKRHNEQARPNPYRQGTPKRKDRTPFSRVEAREAERIARMDAEEYTARSQERVVAVEAPEPRYVVTSWDGVFNVFDTVSRLAVAGPYAAKKTANRRAKQLNGG